MGKGCKPRPVNKEKFNANWDSIFKKAAAEAVTESSKTTGKSNAQGSSKSS